MRKELPSLEDDRPHVLPCYQHGSLVAALLGALLTVPVTYALLRAHDVIFATEPNPATVFPGAPIAMFSRLTVAGYLAPMVGLALYVLARRSPALALRGVSAFALVSAALLALQGLFLP